jgi:hypothetical protein
MLIPASCGVHGPGRNDDALRLHHLNAGNCDLIVPANLNLGAEFPEILHQVIGKES